MGIGLILFFVIGGFAGLIALEEWWKFRKDYKEWDDAGKPCEYKDWEAYKNGKF